MLYEAHISLTGYVATQPVTRILKEGVTNVSMRVAWTPRRQDRTSGEWVDTNTSYATVICWRKLATNVAVCLRKGDPVTVHGRLSVREFQDKEGRARTSVQIDASAIGHDLNRGVATFARVRPQTGMTAAEFAATGNGSAISGGGHDEADGRDGGAGHGTVGYGAGEAGFNGSDGGTPEPAEPDPSFFDETAISEQDEPEEAAVAA